MLLMSLGTFACGRTRARSASRAGGRGARRMQTVGFPDQTGPIGGVLWTAGTENGRKSARKSKKIANKPIKGCE